MTSVRRPLLLAHRGSPFIVPEHTLASYAIAIREGTSILIFLNANLLSQAPIILSQI
jgi:hypothetical protein